MFRIAVAYFTMELAALLVPLAYLRLNAPMPAAIVCVPCVISIAATGVSK